jgi:hypothetical protein
MNIIELLEQLHTISDQINNIQRNIDNLRLQEALKQLSIALVETISKFNNFRPMSVQEQHRFIDILKINFNC